MRSSVALRSAVCVVVGGLGGAAAVSSPWGIALGGLYGLLFALLVTPRAGYAGAGLLWGLAYALLAWLAVPAGLVPLLFSTPHMTMLDTARSHFHDLVAYLLYLGLPLGLAHGVGGGGRGRSRPAKSPEERRFSWPRALLVGGMGGLVGGWAFGQWMAQINFFVVIAGLVNSTSWETGVALHYTIAAIIGASFGVLFQRDIRGLGSSLGWGLA